MIENDLTNRLLLLCSLSIDLNTTIEEPLPQREGGRRKRKRAGANEGNQQILLMLVKVIKT
jgi:hypothetical protein